MARNVSLREPRSGIREKIPPFPLKRLERGGVPETGVSLCHRVHRHVSFQPATPLSQRARVVSSVVLEELDREPVLGRLRGGVYQRRGAWERGVWPHVAAHEVFRLAGPVTSFWEGRASDDGGGVSILQSPIDELEVGIIVLSPHMLNKEGGSA